MHEAEKYLRENRGHLYVQYHSEKRRLFLSSCGSICMISKGRRNRGHVFSEWNGVTKIYYPDSVTEKQRKLVEKYKKEASGATFTNPFIRSCLQADMDKDLYENGITTGNGIDGKIISLASIAKANPYAVANFEAAMKKRIPDRSSRFSFRGYEGSLEVALTEHNEPMGYFSMEYKGTANGYYYLLINDKNFIGYDVD